MTEAGNVIPFRKPDHDRRKAAVGLIYANWFLDQWRYTLVPDETTLEGICAADSLEDARAYVSRYSLRIVELGPAEAFGGAS